MMVFAISGWGASATLTLTLNDTPDPAAPGGNITYAAKVAVSGANAANVSVSTTLPVNVTFVSADAGCSLSGSVVTCSYGTINSGNNKTLNFILKAPSTTGTDIVTITAKATTTSSGSTSTATAKTSVQPYVCPNPRTFSVAKTTNIYGNVLIIGNTNMCKNNGSGVCTDPGASRNNDINMMYSDPDGASDPTTFNSSSAKFSLPTHSTIKWAKLYWQGYLVGETDAVKNSAKSVKFAKAGQTYTTIDSNATNYDFNWIYFTSDRYYYQGSADVTAQVLAGGEGNYTVANIVSEIGQPTGGSYGAWALVIVYENLDDTFKNVTVFDGYQGIVTSGDQGTASTYAAANGCSADTGARNSMTIPLSGFLTPKTGTVNSSLSIFAGEGDKGATGDHMALTDKNGVSRYIANALNPYDDIFNSTITYNGSTVTNTTSPVSITPYYSSNSMGADIDTFDVSKDKDGNTLIGNNQTSTNVTLDTSGDGYMPGVFAFSTELYMPELCYDYSYKQDNQYLKADNNGSSGIIPLLTGTISNNPLEVSIYVRNKEADINVQGVSFYSDLNTSVFSYVPGSTGTSNVNGSSYITRIDSSGGCTYDSTLTSTVACNDGNNVRIGLGHNARGYGETTAGYLAGQEFVYAKFEIKPLFPGLQDVNESLGLKLDYYIQPDISAAPSIRNYTFGKDIKLCPPSSGYTPVWGTFNVVDHYAATINGLPANNLHTQISRKPFAVDVATYEKNTDGTYTKVPTIDMNSTVLVEMIDVDAFHDMNASCANPGSAKTPPIYVRIDHTSTDMTINVPVQDASYHNFAVKNAAYRIWYFDQNQSLINWTATTSDTTQRNLTSISGLYQPSYHTECTSACSSATSTTCFNCLKANYAHPICSRDNFAVRPESYDLRIYDVNPALVQTDLQKDATKIDLSTQYQYAPMYASATGRINLAAGYNYRFDLNATGNDANLSGVPGYTRNFNGANLDFNATMIWEPQVGHVTTGCNDTASKDLSFYVANGQMVNTEQNQTQVGDYRLNIIDPSWTAVDWDSTLTGHHTTSNGFELTREDCIVGSDSTNVVNNKVGCITTSAHSGGGYVYKDHLLTLKPAKFDVNSTEYGVGKIPLPIVAGSGYVYDSDVGIDNDMAMSVRSSGPVKAVGYNGEALSNFVKDCYATDLTLSIGNNANLASIPFSGRMTVAETNGTQIFDSLKFNAAGTAVQTIASTYFGKAGNGQTVPTMRFNFDRNSTTPIEPQTVHYSDLNVSCLVSSDCNVSAAYNVIPNTVAGSNAMNFNVTHVYGRIIPRNMRIQLNEPFNATAQYEIYKTPNLIGTPLTLDQFDANWYVNSLHNDANYGDSNVTVVDPSVGSSLPTFSNSVNGVETYAFPAFTVKGGYKAHIDTEGWLWYGGINALPYLDPNGPLQAGTDNLNCLTHPCFNLSTMRIFGNTGSAKTGSEGQKGNKKTSSTGWSTTSEYAPAVQ